MSNDVFSPQESKPPVAVGPLVWGAILIVIGVGWLLATLGVASIPWRAALAAVLVVVGLALLVVSANGPAPEGLFTAGVVLSIIIALLSTASSAFSLPLAGGIGDRQIDPTIATLEATYELVAGQLEIDLSEVDFPEGETRLEASVTFGRVYIRDIPDNVAVSVDARIAAGELAVFGSRWDGISIDQLRSDPGFAEATHRLVIEARVGFGQVEVSR